MAFQNLQDEIRTLQKRMGELRGTFSNLPLLRGTTAERNAAYGVPSTTAQHVALANQKVTYYNTDRGWEESYYAVTGSTGLTARGLMTGAANGWYPTGKGPACLLVSTGTAAQTSGQSYDRWDFSFGNAHSWRRGGALCGVPATNPGANNARVTVKLAGVWDVRVMMSFPGGSGTGVASLRSGHVTAINGLPASTSSRSMQFPVPLLSNYGQAINYSLDATILNADSYVYFQTDAASWSIGGADTRIFMEYIAPPLVKE